MASAAQHVRRTYCDASSSRNLKPHVLPCGPVIVHAWGVTFSYDDVLARNIRAERGRNRLGQAAVVARMRALGYEAWHRQTLGKIERGERRLTAAELLGLTYAMGTSIAALLTPPPGDKTVAFPAGQIVPAESVRNSLHYGRDRAVTWEGNNPVFSDDSPPDVADAYQQMAASLPPEAGAVFEKMAAAAATGDIGAILKDMPPEVREALTGQGGDF